MKVSIRNATIKDAEAIVSLTDELGYKSNSSLIQNRLTEILKNNENCIFVAVNNEKVIGWVHGFYSLRIESDPFVEIGGLIVKEKYWKKGIGKTLLESVFKWSLSKNCKKIRVRCNTMRTESHKFYEKIEFTLNKEQKVFDKILLKK